MSLAIARLLMLCGAAGLVGCHGMDMHRGDGHGHGFRARAVHVPHDHKAHSCKGAGNCNVTIKFACDPPSTSPPTADKCEVYADPEIVAIDRVQRIMLTVDSRDIDFERDGIAFESSYITCSPQSDHKKFVCDANISSSAPPGFYKYSIHVTSFDIVDPWVVNY